MKTKENFKVDDLTGKLCKFSTSYNYISIEKYKIVLVLKKTVEHPNGCQYEVLFPGLGIDVLNEKWLIPI
tara:strand:+ start:350 stop:559 length:210 start_codon:yes stop_codon:yes gene_type:complete